MRNSSFDSDRNEQSHRGKGPKGYKRSDERITEDVNDRLSDDQHIDASNIEVSVEKGEVTLKGTVSRREEKRHAEDIIESISGVTNVENKIRVSSERSSGSSKDLSDSRESKSEMTSEKSRSKNGVHA
ncbi:MAG: BON domain-containing protein [Cyclobacteriaceae bacterium]|nr:BON domain-containing protein [Cyclobacteriaceae bacterium]